MARPLPKKVLNAIKSINEKLGEGTLIILSEENSAKFNVVRISSGITKLDSVLDGGFPTGTIVEFYGHPQSGKSTLSMILIGAIQKAGGICAYIDAEHGLDLDWSKRFGVDKEQLLFSQPDNGEQALDTVIALIRANVDLIVVDSVAALTPMAELEDDIENKNVALLARLMSKAMRMILTALKDRNTIVIFINQYTTSIGGMHSYGGPQYGTKGGLALKQASHLRLEVVSAERIKHPKAEKAGALRGQIGQLIQVRVTKSKHSIPYKSAEFNVFYYTAKQLEEMGIEVKKDAEDTEEQEGQKTKIAKEA